MPTNTPLTLRQANDEILWLYITPDDPLENMMLITSLSMFIKDSPCMGDGDPSTTILTTSNPAQLTIMGQTALLITVRAIISSAILAAPHPLWWRIDAYVGSAHRTAMYGPITVVDL
jgi:hypothetical protein